MNIAQAVYAYISSRGIQQKFIAEKCGWSKQKTSAIIRGKKKMTAEELANICDALSVPYDYFCYNANKRVKHASQVCFSRTHA